MIKRSTRVDILPHTKERRCLRSLLPRLPQDLINSHWRPKSDQFLDPLGSLFPTRSKAHNLYGISLPYRTRMDGLSCWPSREPSPGAVNPSGDRLPIDTAARPNTRPSAPARSQAPVDDRDRALQCTRLHVAFPFGLNGAWVGAMGRGAVSRQVQYGIRSPARLRPFGRAGIGTRAANDNMRRPGANHLTWRRVLALGGLGALIGLGVSVLFPGL